MFSYLCKRKRTFITTKAMERKVSTQTACNTWRTTSGQKYISA